MATAITETITNAIRDHAHNFTEADLDFLHLEIYRNWFSETHGQTIFAFTRFVYLLDYWGFISKISPAEKAKLVALFRMVNNITDEDLRRVKK